MQSREARRTKNKRDESEQKAPKSQLSRRPLLYIFSFVILVIIVVTFIGGPLLSGIGGRSSMVFGSWGGEEIKYIQGNYLSRQVEALSDQLRESGSEQSYEWQLYSVWKGAFDRTVSHTAILVMGERSGLHISEDRVDQFLVNSGPYMVDGVFSEERYRNTSNADRYLYRTLVRDDMLDQQYRLDLNHNDMFSTRSAEFFRDMAAVERSFQFAELSFADYPDDEVASFGARNAELFRRIRLSRITVRSNRDEAEAIRQQILDGVATFEDQAINYSTDGFSDRGGEMGWREYQNLRTDFPSTDDLDEVFGLSRGELSEVYEASFGFVFYRIDEEAVAPDFDDEEILSSVRSYMGRFERGQIEDYLIAEADSVRETVTDDVSFAEAAASRSLEVRETGYFPINYGGEFFLKQPGIAGEGDSAALQEAAFSEQFYTELFALESGETTEPIVLGENVAVFRLLEEREVESEEISYLVDYYPFIYQQYLDQDLNDYIFSSDDFENNFAAVFSESLLGQ